MVRRRGQRRKLTDAQITRVLAWHSCWQTFWENRETARSLAHRLRVAQHVIYSCIARYRRLVEAPSSLATERPTVPRGRPRALADNDARSVIAWHLERQCFWLCTVLQRHWAASSG
jgi:transposase